MALSANMNVMLRAAEKAAKSLLRDFGEVEQLQVSRKGPGDFVSAADTRSEEILFEELSKTRPDYAFLMEESGVRGNKDAESRWIIDPLDGTMNFLHGIPHWNISIALETRGEVVAGLVFDPVQNELFRAEKGTGAFMRNKRLRVSGRTNIDQAIIITGGARHDPELFMKEFTALQGVAAGMRRFGAAALDLAYIAAGRAEVFWEHGVKPWDVAAGCLIVKEAGGVATDIYTAEHPIKTNAVLATNGALYDPVKKLLVAARN